MRYSRRFLIASFPLFIHLIACAQTDTDKIQQVEKGLVGPVQIAGQTPWTIQERMAHYKVPGLSMAVIQNYRIAWAKGYGFADDSLKIPVTTQTLFQAASLSKSLNAVGVLKLVQDKRLDLYTDINTYLTSWKFPYDSLSKDKKITVANLLSHTAGLNVHGFIGYQQRKTLPTIVQMLGGSKPANSPAIHSMYEPGLKSEYSGGGILVSEMIVMDVTHQSYADYMKNNVLGPLGMTSSTYTQPPVVAGSTILATGYGDNDKQIPGKYYIYPEQAAAGLWTNPTDLAKYIIETQLAYAGKSAKVLNQANTQLQLTPYLDKSAALGVFINELDHVKYFQHGGSNVGFRCIYFGSLEGGNGVVVMVNSNHDEIMSELINSIAKAYGFKGLYKSQIKQLVTVPDEVLKTYVGQYELSPKFSLTISKEGSQLYAQATGQKKFLIYPETQTKFFPREFLSDLEFVKDTTGNINGAILYQGGQQAKAKKVK